MSNQVRKSAAVCALMGLIVVVSGTAQANWSETFGGNAFDLTTWLFRGYPELTGTFSGTIQDGPDNDDYLALDETSPAAAGGTQLGVGIGDPDDIFSDVRVGALFNVSGDASRNYHGLAARISYFIDDGSISGYPGMVANTYVMVIHYEEGPGNLKVELVKAANNQTGIMATWQPEVPVPGLGHSGTRYFELDVVGADPVYITGSVYEYKGGPLLVRTPTFIDTSGNDPWEAPGIHDDVFASGSSGIFGMWEDPQSAGYHSPFDSVSSVSDGPAAVNPGPADGATGVSVTPNLSWVEAAFATSRELWLGKQGAMQKVAVPAGTTFAPGPLEFGWTYEWRIDQVGPSGTVKGHTWTFTTPECQSIDAFESYADDAAIRAVWPHNIGDPYQYVFLETGTVSQGAKSMRFEYQNQYEPYMTETTKTFATAQDWTANGVKAISLSFRGDDVNLEQPMHIKLEDSTGKTAKVPHPYTHAVQSEAWHQWDVALEDFAGGINLAAIKKISIGVGSGMDDSGQQGDDADVVYIDDIRLCPATCINPNNLDLRGDVNGDCMVDFKDFSVLAGSWLNEGSWP